MKIAASSLQFETSYRYEERYALNTELRAWRDAPRDRASHPALERQAAAGVEVSISNAARCADASGGCTTQALEEAERAAEHDPRLRLIRALIALLTGKDPLRLNLIDRDQEPQKDATPELAQVAPTTAPVPSDPENAPALGWGIEFSEKAHYSESEQLDFAASGLIRTADGQEIHFELSLSMRRSFSISSETSLKLGDAARPKKDPLILNFAGPAAQLTNQRFAFDLDADGDTEQIHFANGGSGFLALDRDNNGRIDNGSELFGALSGDGFAELGSLDQDGNGWIDENDPAFAHLRVLSKQDDGEDRLTGLSAAGVGAIALAHARTPFEIRSATQGEIGQLRSSGVYLTENGSAGIVQQIDLTV